MKDKTVQEELTHADRCLGAAKLNIEGGYEDAAFNRLYYTAFHAARALAVSKGHQPKTHKTVFGSEWVVPEVFNKEDSTMYRKLMDFRATADYGYFADLTLDEARTFVPEVETFLERVKGVLA